MKIQPRRGLLDIWRAVSTSSYPEPGKWHWGGRHGSNSVSDAQQLLCLMYPATEIANFGLDRPDYTDDLVVKELRNFGTAPQIPVLLVAVLHEYFDRYTDDEGTPVFGGGSLFDTPNEFDVVESYSTSVTLTLATLQFTKFLLQVATREALRDEAERLHNHARKRLTAAMVGLMRSFSIGTFHLDSPEGHSLQRAANQQDLPQRRLVTQLGRELQDVASGLSELSIGSGQGKELDSPEVLFECGWSWGVIEGTPRLDFVTSAGRQPDGVAEDKPYLYFTMLALDSIAGLFTDRTRRLALLDEEQQPLSRALQTRWDLTQRYWSVLARFGQGRWPLEDIPWRTSDGFESDYLTALVAGVALRDLTGRRADDVDIARIGRVLAELANRGRITRRAVSDDRQVAQLQDPGYRLRLFGTTDAKLTWPVQDYSAVLLKRTLQAAALLKDADLRVELLDLSDEIWHHLTQRRIHSGPARGMWDQPGQVFHQATQTYDEPSWQMTLRVVESLVIAADIIERDPIRSERLQLIAHDMLYEAEHVLNQELFRGASDSGPAVRRMIEKVAANLERARELQQDRPATAIALLKEALLELDRLAAARMPAYWLE